MNKKYEINDDVESILFSPDDLDGIIHRIAEQIDRDYPDHNKKLLLLCILKGSVVFMGDLMKAIQRPVEIDFMRVSSYGSGTSTSGTVNIILDLHRHDIQDLDIIVVEDIVDSGRTLSYLCKYLSNRNAKSVRTVTLLDKPSRREVDFTPDYVGAQIEDNFVVGFGLDYNEMYRSLPYVGILKPSVYENKN